MRILGRVGAIVRVRDTKSGANGTLPRTLSAYPVRTDPNRIQANDTPPLDPLLSINPPSRVEIRDPGGVSAGVPDRKEVPMKKELSDSNCTAQHCRAQWKIGGNAG